MKPHYQKIRKVKTHSGSTAIQVGYYKGKNFQLIKHIGSSKDKLKINDLINVAYEYIKTISPQQEINFNPQSDQILYKKGLFVNKGYLQTAYDYLERIYSQIGFTKTRNLYLKHFVMIRLLEPASKIKSIKLLIKYFDICYKKTTVFRELSKLVHLKNQVQEVAIKYAKDYLNFDFSLVFYDVTTLYFETHESDEFRLNGFSKDNKINQPQILIGLVVNNIGFPVYYDIFKGNTFEGKTILPVILNLKSKYNITRFTVIADAGMLCAKNLTELEYNNVDYVVGARIATLNIKEVQKIAVELNKTDNKLIRKDNLIFEYSSKRAKKDKSDNDKQIKKAEYYLSNPSKIWKKSKFLSNIENNKFKLNTTIIEKHRLLEGIKGYKTNIKNIEDKLLVERYKDLWKIEQAFRIAKSDLEARPIYHRRQNSIAYHILIVFVSLCMAKIIELDKKQTIKKVMEELKDIWTLELKDEISGNTHKIIFNKIPH